MDGGKLTLKHTVEVKKDKPHQLANSAVWIGKYQSISKIVKSVSSICDKTAISWLISEDTRFLVSQLLLYT